MRHSAAWFRFHGGESTFLVPCREVLERVLMASCFPPSTRNNRSHLKTRRTFDTHEQERQREKTCRHSWIDGDANMIERG